MNKRLKALLKTCTAFTCAIAVCFTSTIVYADDSVKNLEQKTSNLQNKLDSLNSQLNGLSREITDLASKIEDTDEAVKKAELDLAAAKLNESLQYEAMKKRIKYMYEAGNPSLLQIIFSSESMGEFLNNTEFVKNVTEYDREMLNELQDIHEDIDKKEKALKEEQAGLEKLKGSLDSRRNSLTSTIASTSGELQASSTALAEAKAAQAAAEEALNRNPGGSGSSSDKPSENKPSGGSKPSENKPSGDSKPGNDSITVPPTQPETNELVLLAAILQCEAGSSNYNALLAVATVIMNRVESGRYPNTISGVIYQRGQFSPTWNGSLNRVLRNGPAKLCYQVAQDAINGTRLSTVKNCYSFRAAWTGHAGTVVGGNVFF